MRNVFFKTVIILFLSSVSSVHAITITWTTVDYPGGHTTNIYDIDGGNFVGSRGAHGDIGYPGFLYDGTWATLDLPGAISGISGGNIVGTYGVSGIAHGFIYDGTGWTTLDYPGASGTSIHGIDGSNIVGSADSHGIIYNLDSGTWTILDYPGASQTSIIGIDGDNYIGYSSAGKFLYDGTDWTILDLPGEITGISGSNIVGTYFDVDSGDSQGFLYNGTSWTPLAFPGALVTHINGIDGDNIVGQYLDTDGRKHGFIGTIPEPTTLALFALGACLLRKRR